MIRHEIGHYTGKKASVKVTFLMDGMPHERPKAYVVAAPICLQLADWVANLCCLRKYG